MPNKRGDAYESIEKSLQKPTTQPCLKRQAGYARTTLLYHNQKETNNLKYGGNKMLKGKKTIVITVLVFVLMVAMATSAFADAATARLTLTTYNAVYSGYVVSSEGRGHGWNKADSTNNMNMYLQWYHDGSWDYLQSIDIGPATTGNIPTHQGEEVTDRWRVRLYPWFGQGGCNAEGTVYDY
jgi:hypothetical protein